MNQLRALLQQPEVVLGTWRSARTSVPDLTEAEVRAALDRRDPLWEELFPAEQARIIPLLIDRVDVGPDSAGVPPVFDGLAAQVRDLGAGQGAQARVAE